MKVTTKRKECEVENKNNVSAKQLATQCGGHQEGFKDAGQGVILKQMQPPPRGQRELEFYQNLFAPECQDRDILELRGFVPQFLGVEEEETSCVDGKKFLKLSNLTKGFTRPCVADIKMGRVTHDQEANEAKIQSEARKWPPRTKLGYGLTGMIVYSDKEKQPKSYDKHFGLKLTLDNVVKTGLGTFYGMDSNGGRLRCEVIRSHIQKLQQLQSWFLRQRKFSFVASSIFLVYEGDYYDRGATLGPEVSSMLGGGEEANRQNIISHSGLPNESKDSSKISKQIASSTPPQSFASELTGVNQEADNIGEPVLKKLKQEVIEDSTDIGAVSDSTCRRCVAGGVTKCIEKLSTEADVWLIDFAHVFPSTEVDENFLFGLKNLITALGQLLTLND